MLYGFALINLDSFRYLLELIHFQHSLSLKQKNESQNKVFNCLFSHHNLLGTLSSKNSFWRFKFAHLVDLFRECQDNFKV